MLQIFSWLTLSWSFLEEILILLLKLKQGLPEGNERSQKEKTKKKNSLSLEKRLLSCCCGEREGEAHPAFSGGAWAVGQRQLSEHRVSASLLAHVTVCLPRGRAGTIILCLSTHVPVCADRSQIHTQTSFCMHTMNVGTREDRFLSPLLGFHCQLSWALKETIYWVVFRNMSVVTTAALTSISTH